MIRFEEMGLASLFAAYKPSDAENSARMIDISTPIVTEFQNTQAYVIFYECVKELLVNISLSGLTIDESHTLSFLEDIPS